MCCGAGTSRSWAASATCQLLGAAVSSVGTSAMPWVAPPEPHAEANGPRSTVNDSGVKPPAATYLAFDDARLQSTAGGLSGEPATSSLKLPVAMHACNVAVSGATEPSELPPIGRR